MTSARKLNLVALGFFLVVILIVFWQIETDLKEQGIASGGPYDNAAAYPYAVGIFVSVLLAFQLGLELIQGRTASRASEPDEEVVGSADIGRAVMMLVIFAIYVMVLTTIGYHLATAPMIFAVMWICGMRNVFKLAISSLAIATGFAFIFEVLLNVVLPLGIWSIYIPW